MKRAFILGIWTAMAWAQVNEEMTVTVREMRIHVLDRNGQPVKDLGPESFLLSQKAGPSELSFFEEVDLQLASDPDVLAEVPGKKEEMAFAISDSEATRKVVLFVDSSHLTKRNFDEVKGTLTEFIQNRLNPSDQIKIIHWDEGVNHLTGFSQDREKSIGALDNMKFVGRMRREMVRAQRAIDSEIKEWDVVENPEVRYSYENIINQLIRQKARLKADHYRTFYLNMLSVGSMLEMMDGPKSIFLFTGGSYLEVSSTFGDTSSLSEKLGRVLNRANSTIYTIMLKQTNPVGGNPPYLQSQAPTFTNQFKYTTGFPPNNLNSAEVAMNTIAEDNSQIESGPAAAADATGGVFLKSFGDTKLEDQLDQIQNVSSHYYRLAFSVNNPGKTAKVKVRLKDKGKGWKLLYGSEYEQSTPYLELPKDERQIAMQSLLLYGSKFRDDFAADWDMKVFGDDENGYRVAMMGKFDLPKHPKAGLEMGFVLLDAGRELITFTTPTINKFPKTKNFSFYDVLLSKKQPTYLRFYVRNLDSGEYSFREFTTDSTGLDQTTRISELIMDQPGGERAIALNQLDFVKQGEGKASDFVLRRSELDPFRMQDKVYLPDIKPYAFEQGVLGFFFHLENPNKEGKPYQVQYLVKSTEGYLKVPGRVITSWVDKLGSIHFQGQIKADELPKGTYALHVRVTQSETKESFTQGVSFDLQ